MLRNNGSGRLRGSGHLQSVLREFIEHDAGGHFAAWEQPAAYADDLRRAVRLGARSERAASLERG